MDWETVEAEVKRIMNQLLGPIITQTNEHKATLKDYGKLLVENKNRIEALEVAVFHSHTKKTAFDDIYENLESML